MPSFKFGLPLAPCNLVSFVYDSPLCLPPFLAAVNPFFSPFDFLPFHVLGVFCLCVCYILHSAWGAPNSVCCFRVFRSGWRIASHFPSLFSLFASRPAFISRHARHSFWLLLIRIHLHKAGLCLDISVVGPVMWRIYQIHLRTLSSVSGIKHGFYPEQFLWLGWRGRGIGRESNCV